MSVRVLVLGTREVPGPSESWGADVVLRSGAQIAVEKNREGRREVLTRAQVGDFLADLVRAPDRERPPEAGCYAVSVECDNCGKREVVSIERGRAVGAKSCPNCSVRALRMIWLREIS